MKKGLLYLEYIIMLYYGIFLIHLVYKYQSTGMFSTLNINWTFTQILVELLKAGLVIGAIELLKRLISCYCVDRK